MKPPAIIIDAPRVSAREAALASGMPEDHYERILKFLREQNAPLKAAKPRSAKKTTAKRKPAA